MKLEVQSPSLAFQPSRVIVSQSNYADRIIGAVEHEAAVHSLLKSHGFEVCHFGQGRFSPAIQAAIKQTASDCYVRWIPDFIAARRDSAGVMQIYFFDAKYCDPKHTENYAIEISSYRTLNRIAAAFEIPTNAYFVFSGFRVATPMEIIHNELSRHRPDPPRTPFVLVRQSAFRHFEEVFGGAK